MRRERQRRQFGNTYIRSGCPRFEDLRREFSAIPGTSITIGQPIGHRIDRVSTATLCSLSSSGNVGLRDPSSRYRVRSTRARRAVIARHSGRATHLRVRTGATDPVTGRLVVPTQPPKQSSACATCRLSCAPPAPICNTSSGAAFFSSTWRSSRRKFAMTVRARRELRADHSLRSTEIGSTRSTRRAGRQAASTTAPRRALTAAR